MHSIVVYGDDMKNAVVPNSAKPFNFQKAYKLKDEDVNKNHLTFQLIFNNTYHKDMSYYCTFSLQNLCWV